MRITAGALRGRRLVSCRGRATRPTSSKVREAIFNLLGVHIEGARVLDLFAGSGALGIEALSRGACSALFVDSSALARRTIKKNLSALELPSRGRVLGGGTKSVLGSLSRKGERFDIVFVDPPYGGGMAEETLEAVSAGGLLTGGGVVVVECGKRESLGKKYGALRLRTSRLYGDTRILLFEIPSGGSREALERQ
ncbi:MAG: 16S rRNA (guanine(966)-N(2))-methyltransferase RsmD [Candidatus Eiseniibacteriota bacterium]|nr:MAG: 16S rRNA (guanine(966)-N(2))-methyltransferase RsmD [Candidatus Eisenbacteria bacterium]